MPAKRKFTEEEMKILQKNPNIVAVSPSKLSYSLAFKKKAIDEASQGMTAVDIFTQAGLGLELMGKPRIYAALKSFKREAASEEGLHEPRGKSKEARMDAFAKNDLTKKQTKTAIRELQDKVVHHEQQIEFLKKTHFPHQ